MPTLQQLQKINYKVLPIKKWEEFVEKNQVLLQIIAHMQESGKCIYCKHRIANWDEFEFHAHSTHGIPREIIVEVLNAAYTSAK